MTGFATAAVPPQTLPVPEDPAIDCRGPDLARALVDRWIAPRT